MSIDTRELRAVSFWSLYDRDAICDEVDRLRAVVKAADEVWRCQRCNGSGIIAPGSSCQTCAGDGVRVDWADDGSDLRPLIDALAALDGDA